MSSRTSGIGAAAAKSIFDASIPPRYEHRLGSRRQTAERVGHATASPSCRSNALSPRRYGMSSSTACGGSPGASVERGSPPTSMMWSRRHFRSCPTTRPPPLGTPTNERGWSGTGTPAPYVDAQIAAIAQTNGLVLVTGNPGDFKRYEDLEVQDWTKRTRRR